MARHGVVMATAPPLQLVLVGAGRVGRRLIALLDELDGQLPFAWTLVGCCSPSRGGWFDANGVAPGTLDAPPGGPVTSGAGIGYLAATLPRLAAPCRAGRVVVVETSGLDPERGEPALSHVRAALDAGAHVVTANKGPAAFAWRALALLARKVDRAFLCESAVMDGVPVFSLVADALPAARVTAFRGVVNTTCGYILTALERGEPFDAALAEMQRRGIAEADPALDLDGWDAAAKAAALANALLDAGITPHDVVRRGIRDLEPDALTRGRAQGLRLRHVVRGARGAGAVITTATPEWLAADDPLAQVSGLENALYLSTDPLGEIGIVQRDGGLTQTAYGLVADLARVSRRLAGR
ncbi:MAG: homoserine dehydrogenase [Vicinamibacterales bacterium]